MRSTVLLWSMKVLCVAEKPSIAKAIADALGGGRFSTRSSQNKYVKNYDCSYNFPGLGPCDVTVTSVLGHIQQKDFITPFNKNWQSIDPIQLFQIGINTELSKNGKDVANNIQREARDSQKLYIWTDCDREGEHIGWQIVEVAKSGNARLHDGDIKRAQFNNVEKTHLIQAAGRPVELDMKQVDAVEVRMEIDLRIGASFTRFQTLTLRPAFPAGTLDGVISYGSCQFPTLGFVVDRYKRVKEFVPEPFWYIDLKVQKDSKPVQCNWERDRLFDRMAVIILYERCLEGSHTATVLDVKKKPTTKFKPLPLTTVELQKSGAKYLKLSSKRVMDVAEKLYTKGFISYPRTETDQFDKAIDLKKLIELQKPHEIWGAYAEGLIQGQFREPRKGKHNDKAHPPIHPIKTAGPQQLDRDEAAVFEFVVRHFLACCSDDAKGVSTTVSLDWFSENFKVNGLVVKERNFLEVYPYIVWNTSEIPDFAAGEVVRVQEAKIKEGKTTPPNYLTESELIALMDANGIGTDATMAEHIEKIIERNYVSKLSKGNTKYLIPTTLGMALVESYDKIDFSDMSLTKPFLRKEMEENMKKICEGKTTKVAVINTSIEKYRRAFTIANRNKNVLVTTLQNYIRG